jgi:hypothetical protein
MSYALYQYPEKALVNRIIPKTKFYEKAGITKTVKDIFIKQIQSVAWAYKLSPETINLSSTKDLLEIQVFNIELKSASLDERILMAIDKAIPHPIIFQVNYEKKIKVILGYKRINESDGSKWIIDQYFSSNWLSQDEAREIKQPLPLSSNLSKLYEQILKTLMPIKGNDGEHIRELTKRLSKIELKQREIEQLEQKIRNEKQFNRKVEMNNQLKVLKNEIAQS